MTATANQTLLAISRAEIERRRNAGADQVGSWAHITDPSTADRVGEEVVQVAERGSSSGTVKVRRFFYQESKLEEVQSRHLRPCLAIGDRVKVSGEIGTVVVLLPCNPEGTATTPAWDGDSPKTVSVANARDTGYRVISRPGQSTIEVISPRTNDLRHADGHMVRGLPRGETMMGPDLSLDNFLSVALPGEFCMPRKDSAGNPVTDGPNGETGAVLVDFIGGATLWVWRTALVTNNFFRSWMDRSPSAGHYPPLDKCPRPYTATKPAKEIMTQQQSTLPTNLAAFCRDITTCKDSIVEITNGYHDELCAAISEARRQWTGEDLADFDADLDELNDQDMPNGGYRVRNVKSLDLADGYRAAIAVCCPLGENDGSRFKIAIGLRNVTLASSNALAARSGEGLMQRASRSLSETAMGALKDGARGMKDLALGEAQRKGNVLLDEATGETVAAVYGQVQRFMLGAGAGLMGSSDPAAVANNVAATTAFDVAAKGLARGLAGLLAGKAPALAQVISAGVDNLERRLDERGAHKVLDAVAPIAMTAAKAIGAPLVRAVTPAALPAPASTTPALEPAPEDRPKRSRKPKAQPTEGAAPKAPRKSKAKAAAGGGGAE